MFIFFIHPISFIFFILSAICNILLVSCLLSIYCSVADTCCRYCCRCLSATVSLIHIIHSAVQAHIIHCRFHVQTLQFPCEETRVSTWGNCSSQPGNGSSVLSYRQSDVLFIVVKLQEERLQPVEPI